MQNKNGGGNQNRVRLKKKEREYLRKLLSRGVVAVKLYRRAQRLLLLDSGKSRREVGRMLLITPATVNRVGRRYLVGGFSNALSDDPRPGSKRKLNTGQVQRVVALACTPSPLGRSRWTVRLLTEEALRREVIPKVSRETIRVILKDHDLKPWREKNVVHSGADATVHRENGRHS